MTDSGNNNSAANSNLQMSLSLYNNVQVHHINIVVLASDIMSNPQTMRVLNYDVVTLSTGTIYGTDNSNELQINQNLLIIGMANNKHIVDQWDSPNAPLQDIEFHVCHSNIMSAVFKSVTLGNIFSFSIV